MALNQLENGVGPATAHSLDIIRESGMALFNNENECRKDLSRSQIDFANQEAEKIVESYQQQAQQSMIEGITGMMGSSFGDLTGALSDVRSGNLASKAEEYKTFQNRIDTYKTEITPKSSNLLSEGIELADLSQPSSKIIGKTAPQLLDELKTQLDPKQKDFLSDKKFENAKNLANDLISGMDDDQKPLNGQPLVDRCETERKQEADRRIGECERDSKYWANVAGSMRDWVPSAAKAAGTYNLRESKKEEGDANAAKTIFELLVTLMGQARDIFNNACQMAVENIRSAVQAYEAVYNNSGLRG